MIDLDTERDSQDVIKATVSEVNRTINTTVGRVLLNDHLPKEMPYVNGTLKKKGCRAWSTTAFCAWGIRSPSRCSTA